MRKLVRQMPHKVFLILDNHPVHRSGVAKKWLRKHADEIELFFLPSYSPELNPDELLNQDVKTNAVGKNRARNKTELMRTVRSFLYSK